MANDSTVAANRRPHQFTSVPIVLLASPLAARAQSPNSRGTWRRPASSSRAPWPRRPLSIRTSTSTSSSPGEGAQPAALRILDERLIERFPSNGFIALEETIQTRARELIGFARAYAKGTMFTIANPEAAVRILYDVSPFTRPTGKDEATAVREDVHVLRARIPQLKLEPAGVRRRGETNEANLGEYMEFLQKWGVLKQRVDATELMTIELIGEINRFDADAIAKAAREYRPR